jgi:sugar/nucleoside kinase (ribokinase family)
VRRCDLLVVGDINPDLVLAGGDVVPRFGQREGIVESGRLTVGGSAAITACGAARLGTRTAIAGVVGDDAFGRFMLGELRERGVDVAPCRVDGGLDTGVTVILSRGDDRAMLTALGAIPALVLEDVLALVEHARHVHLSSLALQPALASAVPELVRSARAAGTTVSADPNWDPSERWTVADALRAVDVAFPNAEEALRLTGRSDRDVEAAAAALAADGPLVVVTLGADGAVAHDGRTALWATAPAVDVVDTTGAGDTFSAGFISARLAGAPLAEALALGCACGARSVGAFGGVDAQPTRAEAETLLAARPSP